MMKNLGSKNRIEFFSLEHGARERLIDQIKAILPFGDFTGNGRRLDAGHIPSPFAAYRQKGTNTAANIPDRPAIGLLAVQVCKGVSEHRLAILSLLYLFVCPKLFLPIFIQFNRGTSQRWKSEMDAADARLLEAEFGDFIRTWCHDIPAAPKPRKPSRGLFARWFPRRT